MWRTTGDVKWREHGYKVFQAIEKHARTKFGYSTVRIESTIDEGNVFQFDYMPRYLYFIYYI
jgi:mannosyl-oligosaccharide alpha-1,2-mannosidase